eukprot:CAMPEP_0173124164 /NCGR_PEP_ID=MMETSP1102-20130122/55469_1 /TAXON_ID=49646 /ORGANISM="Geminigera sp., Strain Caron Lab Isolate" /LENGTH=95 /DNA_ID=CAMNT_0014032411 /DNA_START=466 /DNA_END=753 /DNA_ORIENTATION=-
MAAKGGKCISTGVVDNDKITFSELGQQDLFCNLIATKAKRPSNRDLRFCTDVVMCAVQRADHLQIRVLRPRASCRRICGGLKHGEGSSGGSSTCA